MQSGRCWGARVQPWDALGGAGSGIVLRRPGAFYVVRGRVHPKRAKMYYFCMILHDFVVTLVSEEPRRKTEITCVIVRLWVFAESSEKASRARVAWLCPRLFRSPRGPPHGPLDLLAVHRPRPTRLAVHGRYLPRIWRKCLNKLHILLATLLHRSISSAPLPPTRA